MGIHHQVIPVLGEEIGVGSFRRPNASVFACDFSLDQHRKGAGDPHLENGVSLQHFPQLIKNAGAGDHMVDDDTRGRLQKLQSFLAHVAGNVEYIIFVDGFVFSDFHKIVNGDDFICFALLCFQQTLQRSGQCGLAAAGRAVEQDDLFLHILFTTLISYVSRSIILSSYLKGKLFCERRNAPHRGALYMGKGTGGKFV